MLKAIETHYHGYRFRSRLEARWAVFFDALGVTYVYEPQGYDLNGKYYLPDFWLPGLKCFVEVKPTQASYDEIDMARRLADQSKLNVLLIEGSPGLPRLDAMYGFMVEASDYYVTALYGHMGRGFSVYDPIKRHMECLSDFLQEKGVKVSEFNGTYEHACEMIELDKVWYYCKHGKEHPYWHYGLHSKELLWLMDGDSLSLSDDHQAGQWFCSAPLRYAHELARKARFEHGETPHIRPYWHAKPTILDYGKDAF